MPFRLIDLLGLLCYTSTRNNLTNDVHYRKIIAGCDSENIGSCKVMEKVGMKREAVLREHIKRKDGTWGDDFQYGLLKREFV